MEGNQPVEKTKLRHKMKFTILFSVFCVAMMVTVVTVKPVQDAEAVIPLVVIAGIIVASAVAGYIGYEIGKMNAQKSDGDGMSADAYASMLVSGRNDLNTARNDELNTIISNLDCVKSLYVSRGNVLAYDYWRAQEDAGTNHTWSYNSAVFGNAGYESITSDLLNVMKNSSALYDSVWKASSAMGVATGFQDLKESFIGGYSSMNYGYATPDGTIRTTGAYQWPEAVISATNGASYFVDEDVTLRYYYNQVGSETLSISHYVNGSWVSVYSMSISGENYVRPGIRLGDITNFTAGIYKFSMSTSHTGAGAQHLLFLNYALPVDTGASNGQAGPAFMWHSADNIDLSDDTVVGMSVNLPNGTSAYYSTGSAYFGVGAGSPAISGDTTTYYVNQMSAMRKLVDVYNATHQLIMDIASSTQAYYTWCVTNNPTAPPPDTTWAFLDPSQMEGLTTQEWLIIYQAWMNWMKDFYDNNTNYLPENVTLSPETMKLLVRGSIYDSNNTLIESNLTIWTPFIFTQAMTLNLGRNNFSQTGKIMIWGYAEHISDLSSPNRTKMINFYNGYWCNITEMTYEGKSVNTIALTLTSLEVWYTDFVNEHGNGTVPPGHSSAWVNQYAVYGIAGFVAGLLVFLVSEATQLDKKLGRKTKILKPIGIILMLAGGIILLYVLGVYAYNFLLSAWEDFTSWF